jgi:hypothetical protein
MLYGNRKWEKVVLGGMKWHNCHLEPSKYIIKAVLKLIMAVLKV